MPNFGALLERRCQGPLNRLTVRTPACPELKQNRAGRVVDFFARRFARDGTHSVLSLTRFSLDGGTHHSTALFGAAVAHFGAAATVIHVMVVAFRAASTTDFCTEAAQVVGELRIALEQRGGRPAKLSAVSIKTDALRHHRDVCLAKTRG